MTFELGQGFGRGQQRSLSASHVQGVGSEHDNSTVPTIFNVHKLHNFTNRTLSFIHPSQKNK